MGGSSFCDLHIHTTASDGQLTPQQVVCHSISLGLSAISICDHDTLSGYLELRQNHSADELGIVRILGLDVIPGIELSSRWGETELHILGYFPDAKDAQFSNLLAKLRLSRLQRIKTICHKLTALGMPIQIHRVLGLARGDSVGRPHIAEAMMEEGYVSSVKEAFGQFLGVGKPAYAQRFHLSPAQCIKAIRAAQGVAVWAHPGLGGHEGMVGDLLKWGLQGIEVYHPLHHAEQRRRLLDIALQENLIVTGGSDFHRLSPREGAAIGECGVPYENLTALKALAVARIKK